MRWAIITILVFNHALAAEDVKKKPAMDPAACPMHDAHTQQAKATAAGASDERFAAMTTRAEEPSGMNFSQTATTHSFVSEASGGYILVEANDANDGALIKTVRDHMQAIARSFAAKDFSVPMFVHGELPTGTEKMVRLADRIAYAYESTPKGARVVIRSKDKKALAAVHSFLEYQIAEHRTAENGDHKDHQH